MINRTFTFAALALFLGFVFPCHAQNKVALVIGNAAYQDSPLRNPVNDATDIAQTLRSVGFTVTLKTNLDKMNMENAVRSFRTGLKTGDMALFYYSGHGMQVNGINYLIPVGESIYSEVEIPYKSMEAQFVIDYMQQAGTSVNIVILDACRDNPFKGFRSQGRGFVPVIAPQGTFIAYSTAPGTVAFDGDGHNSPYTQYLITGIKKNGLQIEDMFKEVRREVMNVTGSKQVPWESSSLIYDFTFNGTFTTNNVNSTEVSKPTESKKASFRCGDSFTVTHTAGDVAPVTKTITYGTVETNITGSKTCWITQNLGADRQAYSPTDVSEEAAGWYWQFNRKQGYKHDGNSRMSDQRWDYNISEDVNWLPFNDPCEILLGFEWRMPSSEELENIAINGGWNNLSNAFSCNLKLHAAGFINHRDGLLNNRGTYGYYWSDSQDDKLSGLYLYLSKSICSNYSAFKADIHSVRCLKDL